MATRNTTALERVVFQIPSLSRCRRVPALTKLCLQHQMVGEVLVLQRRSAHVMIRKLPGSLKHLATGLKAGSVPRLRLA